MGILIFVTANGLAFFFGIGKCYFNNFGFAIAQSTAVFCKMILLTALTVAKVNIRFGSKRCYYPKYCYE